MPGTSRFTQDDAFVIRSDRLEVTLARPGSGLQKGARFDLSGHVVQVILDGMHAFCAPEAMDEGRGSGGLGLCNEFRDVTGAMYEGAAPGGKFPKMGVGLVTRESAAEYSFMTHYEKDPFPVDVSASESSALFTVLPVECRGYAARLKKRLTARSNTLLVEYAMENTGGVPLELTEYNHNFVLVDGHPVGPDYRLSLPYVVEADSVPDVLSIDGGEITWKAVPEGAFFCLPRGFSGSAGHRWELFHKPTGIGMREIDDFPVCHLALWGMSHVVSPEVFVQVSLRPGEAMEWSRRYEFFR